MTKDKAKKIAVKVAVTFLEASIAYLTASGWKFDKVVLAGAVGAGVSAVYNLSKHYYYDRMEFQVSLSLFILGLYVFLQSAVYLGWFSVDPKLLGFVGVAFVFVLILEALWHPITVWRRP